MTTTKQKKEDLRKEVVGDLTEIQKVVKDAIDKGATSVEQVHRSVAKMPLKYLAKIDRVKSAAKDAGDIQDKTIGHIYDLINTVNTNVSNIASDILKSAGK
jgi:methyl-accepting chemotaxis protein